jgi:hypothetical protein
LLAFFTGGIFTEIKWLSVVLGKLGKAGEVMLEMINGVRKFVGKEEKIVKRNLERIRKLTAEINLPKRISKSGMNNKQAGIFFGWGTGKPTKTIKDFTREMLEKNGWTKEILESVADGYNRIGKVDPLNPSALSRAKQLESLLKLFK